MIENLVSYIKDLGFPIALSFYLLVRIESKLDPITELLQVLIEKKDKQ
ncbi:MULTISPECIES: YvrJ family protein [Priestia]|nr:YvrJ family protein [Priestia aryabhattai]